jgi:molybdopterin adenylyltransferase
MIRVAILTISDSVASGARVDESGPALQKLCSELGWQVTATAVAADEAASIAEQLRSWSDADAASLLVTTGGTGIAARDVTPEATRQVLDRELPGIPELMRAKGLEQTAFSLLSRAVAGTRGRSLIVNLPGSPKGAVHSLRSVQAIVPHAINLLMGQTEH